MKPGDRCNLFHGPVVTKIETARAIAEAVATDRGLRIGDKGMLGGILRLSVEPDPDDRRYWLAVVYEEDAQGGGAAFRISRCDGAIRDWEYTR